MAYERSEGKMQMLIELSHAMAAVAADDYDNARGIITAVHTRLVNMNAQQALPGVPASAAPPKSDSSLREVAAKLFSYWRSRCNHPQAKLTPDRATSLIARLREGYSEGEIRKAIDGAATAAYVSEDTGQRYDDVTLICRNGSKLESFIERGIKATGAVEVAVDAASPVEEQITTLRRTMADYKKDGRTNEYEQAASELRKLMSRRSA